MKKEMMVMTIVVALSFLVSLIAVVPLFAKPASQTTPTTKQAPEQGPAQAPQTQKQQFKPPVVQVAKAKFWGLEVDHCVVNNFNPCNAVNTAKKGILTGKCYYKIKTPPINEITEADVAAWSGKAYTLLTSITNNNTAKTLKEEDARLLPQFTWGQVQLWKKGGQGSAPKEWTEQMEFTLDASQNYNGGNIFLFQVDKNNTIPESDGDTNNMCGGSIIIIP